MMSRGPNLDLLLLLEKIDKRIVFCYDYNIREFVVGQKRRDG